ncbi:MAG: PAS domain S-box protein, partial [Betaproteobacteria bacterium]|nr:PAS domain S-box protein [Betaproteobacteria bacterium]
MSTSAALKADGPRSAPLRILMVEDDANDAELLLAHLAQARLGGAQIVHAHTLAEGLELVQSLDVQITLLDLDLPDSQGLYTLERMRAAASGPVIVISGNGHASLVDEALKRRAYDVIPKDELDAATLRRVLRLASLHREAGREQGATESRYRALLESSSEALVLLDAKGRIQYASAAMRRVLGYNSAEILGCSGLSFVRSEDRQAARKAFVGLSAQPGAFATLRARFRHKGGELRVLESSLANRLGDAEVAAIVCSYRDVTQEEEHRERFAATFENSPVGLAHVDLEGRFQLANQRLCAMLGYAPGELIGRAVRELSHREEIDSTAELGEQLRAGVIPQFTTRKRYLRKDGATIWVQLTVSLERDAQGRPMYDIAAFEDVTDAVRAEERLRDSEARLRAIVGAEPECVKLLDAEGRLLEMNPAGLAMIEAESLDVVAGQCVYALIVPAYRQRFKDLTDRVCRGERASLEFEIVGLKGARRWVETHAVPLRDEARGRNLLLGITRDITSRKHAELAAERLRRMYSALSSANEAIFKIKDEQALFRGICELLVEHGGLKLAAVRLVDRATGWLEVAAHAGGSAAYLENARVSVDPERPESRGPAATAAREKCTTVSNDYLADPALAHWHAAAREAGIAAVTSVPLCRNGEVVGLITLYAAETGWFDLELVGLAERMAQNISFALDNADRERERAAVQSALRDSEERFRSLTKLSTDWFWDQDAELRFTSFVGGQSDAKWRADQTQTIGLRRWEIPRLTPLSCSWDEHRAVLEARRPFRGFEYVRVAEDGSRRYVMASGEPVFGADGAFEGYRGTATDISERKRGELALRESEARFRNLVALSSDFHWETDAEHRITVRSEGVRAGTESTVPVTQVIGKRRWELPFVAPDMQVWMAHKAVLDAHLPFQDFELSRPVPDGGARHFSISGEPVFDDQGTFKGYRGVGTDITVRKSALLALELEHAVNRHLAAADSSLAGVQAVIRAICELSEWDHGRFWRVDEDAGVMRFAALWSMEGSGAESLEPGLREVVFLPGQGIAGRVWQSGEPIWVADASNDPRTAKHALWRTPMRGTFMFPVKAAGRALGVLTFASRTIRRPDEHLLVAAGEIGNRIGQFLERKRSEDELRRFRAGMEASGDMILLVDYKTMRYVDVNETACRTLGYTREEMLAMGPHDLLPTSREELQQTYEGFVADPSTIHGMNSVYRCKDGSTIPFESTRRVLHLETGALIVAISRDIRKRLEAEDALRESEERFRGLTQLSSDWYWEQDAELRFVSTAGRDQVRGGLTDAQ